MNTVIYQKIGVAVSRLAQEFLAMDEGDRIASISEYQDKYQVARGTIQNALNYLKESKVVVLRSRGHMGTFIDFIDYAELQKYCIKQELLGIMPLPYSLSYEGLATALYQELKSLDFNMAYIRGAESRVKLVLSGVYDFTVCSAYAAENMVKAGQEISIVCDFGEGSYLSSHVLVLREEGKTGIEDGMRVAYDSTSFDQKEITKALIKGKKRIKLVEMRAHQTVIAIQAGEIDAGVWNYDEILENRRSDIHIVPIGQEGGQDRFSTAVLVVRKENDALAAMLSKFINRDRVIQIQKDVRSGQVTPNF